MKGKHGWQWYFREANDKNILLLINYKKALQFQNVSDKTIHEYQKEVYRFMLYLQSRDIATLDVSTEIVQDYLDSFDASNPRKIRVLSVLNSFYKHNAKKRYIIINPINGINKGKYQ